MTIPPELYILYGCHVTTYWLTAFIFYIADTHLDLHSYKIQQVNTSNLSLKTLYRLKYTSKIALNVARNHTLILIPLSLIYCKLLRSSIHDPLPGWPTICFQLIINYLIHEIQFYSTHRFLHTKFGYQRVHKTHHEFITPIGLSGQYVHPIEFIILFIQAVNGSLILNMHPLITCIWVIAINWTSVVSHCGYSFPFYENTYHDSHHRLFKYNYGSNQWIEKNIFKTSLQNNLKHS